MHPHAEQSRIGRIGWGVIQLKDRTLLITLISVHTKSVPPLAHTLQPD